MYQSIDDRIQECHWLCRLPARMSVACQGYDSLPADITASAAAIHQIRARHLRAEAVSQCTRDTAKSPNSCLATCSWMRTVTLQHNNRQTSMKHW